MAFKRSGVRSPYSPPGESLEMAAFQGFSLCPESWLFDSFLGITQMSAVSWPHVSKTPNLCNIHRKVNFHFVVAADLN